MQAVTEVESWITLQNGTEVLETEIFNETVYQECQPANETEYPIIYVGYEKYFNNAMPEAFEPMLIMGGITTIVWSLFYRTVIILTNHKDIISVWFSSIFYAVCPSVDQLLILNLFSTMIGPKSLKCLKCLYDDNYSVSINYFF